MVQISVLTPLPGTPWHARVADRIFDQDWSHYDYHRVVFEPRRMTASQLQIGHDWVTSEFYKPWRIARRLARTGLRRRGWRYLPYEAAVNAAYYGRVVRWGIRGYDPAKELWSGESPVTLLSLSGSSTECTNRE